MVNQSADVLKAATLSFMSLPPKTCTTKPGLSLGCSDNKPQAKQRVCSLEIFEDEDNTSVLDKSEMWSAANQKVPPPECRSNYLPWTWFGPCVLHVVELIPQNVPVSWGKFLQWKCTFSLNISAIVVASWLIAWRKSSLAVEQHVCCCCSSSCSCSLKDDLT